MGLVASEPDILWGTPCFIGTKVPSETLFTYLEDGATLDQFLADFPSVTRTAAVEALRASHQTLVSHHLDGHVG